MKKITNFENYVVTTCGRVFNIEKNVEVKQSLHYKGYKRVWLRNPQGKGKQLRVNRLVAEAYIPNPNNLPFTNHKNEVKYYNYVSNLEWCDIKYNNNYGDGAKKQNESMKSVLVGINPIDTNDLVILDSYRVAKETFTGWHNIKRAVDVGGMAHGKLWFLLPMFRGQKEYDEFKESTQLSFNRMLDMGIDFNIIERKQDIRFK